MKKILILLLPLLTLSCQKEEILDFDTQVQHFEDSNQSQSGAHITGKIWDDINGNGIQDIDEPGVAGAQVLFVNASKGWIIGKVETNEEGRYIMYASIVINFRLRVILPEDMTGYVLSERLSEYPMVNGPAQTPSTAQASIFDVNSDFYLEGDRIVSEIYSTEFNKQIDCGIYLGGAIGDLVWLDNPVRGLRHQQDVTDMPLSNIFIKLYSYDDNTQEETFVSFTNSDENGRYIFEDIAVGNYFMVVDNPVIYDFVEPNIGDKQVDSEKVSIIYDADLDEAGKSEIFTIEVGEYMNDVDFGFKRM